MDITSSNGVRSVPASDFFQSTWTTDVRDNELVTAVSFPVRGGRSGFAIDEIARRHGDFAIAGVACAVNLDEEDRASRTAISLFGVASTPIRASSAEELLAGRRLHEIDRAELGAVATRDLEPPDDVHASRDYRRKVTAVLVERAVGRAWEEARARDAASA
jgi:carbon-monoxide dehydrogenase medium subunit